MVAEIYYRKALAQMKNKHSLLEEKHALLEEKHSLLEVEHAQMKNKHTKLQEEYAELLNERYDMEGESWFWMLEKKSVQAELSQWKAACASLVKEVERKVLEEDYMAYLAQAYGQMHWPVAKVAELEVELERQLAEAHQLAEEREQVLMAKVAALESEVATLSSATHQMRADFAMSRRSSEETTERLTKELAEAKTETKQHVKANKTLCTQMTALQNSPKTAVARQETVSATKKKLLAVGATKIVEVPTQTQPRRANRQEVELTETLVRLEELKLSVETTVRSKSTPKTAAAPVKQATKSVKLPAQTLQQPKKTKSAAKCMRRRVHQHSDTRAT
uniref:Uncharacterized protein n=1 Tax=Phytophthora ramorum TaxID=164328 RepID=H3H888_PHYRM